MPGAGDNEPPLFLASSKSFLGTILSTLGRIVSIGLTEKSFLSSRSLLRKEFEDSWEDDGRDFSLAFLRDFLLIE